MLGLSEPALLARTAADPPSSFLPSASIIQGFFFSSSIIKRGGAEGVQVYKPPERSVSTRRSCNMDGSRTHVLVHVRRQQSSGILLSGINPVPESEIGLKARTKEARRRWRR